MSGLVLSVGQRGLERGKEHAQAEGIVLSRVRQLKEDRVLLALKPLLVEERTKTQHVRALRCIQSKALADVVMAAAA